MSAQKAKKAPAGSDIPRLEIQSQKDLTDWLSQNFNESESRWLVTFKKGHTGYVERTAILEALLAYGWIDSLPRKLDETRTMLLISKRKPGSNWSKVNRDIALKLIAEGTMKQPGLEAIERAKSDGSWEALLSVEALTIPEDLEKALALDPLAPAYFDNFPPSSKRAILEWILSAKRPETRAARVTKTAEMAAKNLKANFPKGRDKGPALKSGS